MPGKRTNNGIGPGVVTKSICAVPMTKSEKARFSKACEMMDATEGYVAALAIRQWLKRRGI